MINYTQKACPVILRRQGDGWQILAFRHPLAGAQLIKGTVEPDEPLESAVLRELAEESGITQASVVEKIGELVVPESEQHWHIFLCQPLVDLPEAWSFFTTDGGGLFFQFFWHGLADEPDETWHRHFRRALRLIAGWQQGRAL